MKLFPGTRFFLLFLLSLFSLSMITTALSDPSRVVAAQDDPAADAGDAAAEDAPAADAAAGGDGGDQTQSVFEWLFEALGTLYITVFLLLSFTFVALFVMNVITARRDSVCPVGLVESFEACLNEKKYQEAYDMAKADESMLGNVLSAGLAKLSSGYAPAIEAMQEVGEEETMKMQHRLSYIALIGTISPMIGLFGTVHGMISSFYTIATAGATPDPADLAGGISRALLTTLIGLAIAIPAIAVFNILRNRVDRLVLEVGVLSEGLMSRFQDNGAKK
ncbi:MAG: MotA/TolQ/ExbB proton channel family protein [Planctomycetota bacterium]|nr:MotA/TolQ/ExbB proton channel family protein [Planctomycetota bacterium]